MTKTTLLLLLTLSYATSNAQKFLNLGFEYGVYKAQPRKWMIEGDAVMYAAHLDSSVKKEGAKSLFLQIDNGAAYTYLSVPGSDVAGKTIRVEGYARFQTNDSIKLMMAFRDPSGNTITSSPISSTNGGWVKLSHEFKISSDYSSDIFLIAVIGMGTGKYWLDDFAVSLDDEAYGNGQPDHREPTSSELQALDSNSINLDESNSNQSVISLIGSSRIVALGENSHGSATIYKYKLQLIKWLVEQAKFSVFALECPKANAEIVNRYVLGDTVQRKTAVENLVYLSWQKEEIMDIVDWIRKHNQHSANKVQFKGFDVNQGDNQDTRETELARNVDSILQQSDKIKIIVSGDNTHITKASGKMGSLLKKKYGSDYLTVGFTFQSGEYAAYGKQGVYEVHPPYMGTYEYVLSKLKYKNFMLDLRNLKHLPIIKSTLAFRSIGSRPQDVTQFQETNILDHFDVIVNLKRSVPTTNIVDKN